MAYGDAVSPTWTFVGGLAKGTRKTELNHVGQEGMLLFWTWEHRAHMVVEDDDDDLVDGQEASQHYQLLQGLDNWLGNL